MIRILADENMVGLDLLPSDELEIQTLPGRNISPGDLEGVDVLWVRSVTQVTRSLVQNSQLRFVGTATAGLEHIDEEALQEQGIAFAAAPGANANSVVEYVLAALAELRTPWECLERGETLGVVGYGAVGSLLATVAKTLGWSVKVCDPWLESRQAGGDWVSLAEVLKCRVISLHCSLHANKPWPSYHLIDASALAGLDGSQWLINAARGAVIDDAALLEHLQRENPVNCVLDVWEGEPHCDLALLSAPSLKIATAHIAGYSWDAKWQATCRLYQRLIDAGLVSTAISTDSAGASTLKPVEGRGVDFVRDLVRQRYAIWDDDALFRGLAKLAEEEQASGFDSLRKHYRVRRELRGSQLTLPPNESAKDVHALAQALGVTTGTR
ncbi:4-phosphoerythronate dehydrogenase [Congregibacter sp.]|uniref:4-phosphoerythronate dehydrogenase n=1 Tax=Congregibacter sp. TaxID=2744308 RepID=UPI003F6C77B8